VNKFKKDDMVMVTKGKNKGAQGKVLKVFPKDKKLIVEKVNIVKRHRKPSQNSEGGILEMPAPISWANVKVICKKTNKPTRVGFKTIDNKKVRIAKISGESLG
jgi:large subunit ribosomal protein L24